MQIWLVFPLMHVLLTSAYDNVLGFLSASLDELTLALTQMYVVMTAMKLN